MMKLSNSLNAWGTPGYVEVLKRDVQSLPIDALPLQQGLVHGSYVIEEPRDVMVISSIEDNGSIKNTVGVFYNSMLGGCHCADDPSKAEPLNEYCEVQLNIDIETGEATAALVSD